MILEVYEVLEAQSDMGLIRDHPPAEQASFATVLVFNFLPAEHGQQIWRLDESIDLL